MYAAEKRLPDRVNDEPELLPGLDLYLEAFYELDGDRPIGLAVGMIPGSAIRLYAKDYGFDEYQTALLKDVIPKLDRVKLSNDKKRRDSEPPPTPTHKPFRPKGR